jgi:hypothetical protein
LIAVLLAIYLIADAEREDDRRNQDIGRTEERLEGTTEVLQRTEQGNEVRQEVEREAERGVGSALYQQCLLSNRGAPENCQRFLPQRSAAEQ